MEFSTLFIEYLLKFEEKTKKALILNGKKSITLSEFYKIYRKTRVKPINDSIILLFYNDPQTFFKQHKYLLENSSYFDSCGNSIFIHYFNILYEQHKKYQNQTIKQTSSVQNRNNKSIYVQYFDSFFNKHKKYLLIPDICLDTPLHKISRFRDKSFILKIIQKFYDLGILEEEILINKNIKGETICSYIFDEIKTKYKYLLTKDKNSHESLKNFINMLKISYINIYKNIENETKIMLYNFINNYIFDIIKEKKFDNLYKYIYMIVNNEKDEQIFNYIFQPLINMNYLNYLYELCKSNEDYIKLLNLILKILSLIKIKSKKLKFEECIIDHMVYTFRKMNSSNSKGNYEINYCYSLIKNVLSKIIEGKNNKQIIKILNFGCHYPKKKFFKNGLINNLKINPNLNFDQKIDILIILNNITFGLSDQEIGEDFSIYFFYKLIINKQISGYNIIRLYNKDIDFIKIIKEFSIIFDLYDYIYYLCSIFEKKSFILYINSLNKFLFKSNMKYLNTYKYKYNMSNMNLKNILEIILLLVKKCNENQYKIKKDIDNKDLEYEEKVKTHFILSNKNLCEYAVLDILKKNKLDFLALKILFSFRYDFLDIIDKYKNHIIKLINAHNENFTKYLFSIDFSNNSPKIDLEQKTIMKLYNILTKNDIRLLYELPSYKNSSYSIKKSKKTIKKENFQKLCLICCEENSYKKFLLRKNVFIYTYLMHLLYNWNSPLNYSEIINSIKNDIPCYCKYFLNLLLSKEWIIKIINFFFDEFIYLIKPELKENYEFFRTMSLDYLSSINNYQNDDKYQEKNSNGKIFCFLIMLFNIKIKYGDYNAQLLFFICDKFFSFNEAFLIYLDNSQENIEKKERVKHFFLIKKDLKKNMKFEIKNYIYKNISEIKPMNNSIFLNFIIKGLAEKYSKYDLFLPYLHLLNIPLNNEIIFNMIIQLIIDKEKHFFDFLKEDCTLIDENTIIKRLNFLKSVSKHLFYIFKKKQNTPNIYNFDNYERINENNKYNIFINLYRFLRALNKSNISLFDLLIDNFFLIGETISLFSNIYYCIFKQYQRMKKKSKEIAFMLNEMNKYFFSFYNYLRVNKAFKNVKIKQNNLLFQILFEIFCKRIQSFNDKELIYEEYNLFREIIKFLIKKSDINKSDNNNFSKDNIEIIFYDLRYVHTYSISYLVNKAMIEIFKKIPDKFTDASKFFMIYCKSMDIYSQGNLLIRNNSKLIVPHLIYIYSLIKNKKYKQEYMSSSKYVEINIKKYLIKNLLKAVDNPNHLIGPGKLEESDIFRNKEDSLKLLNNSFNEEIIYFLINKISNIFCKGYYELLFIELIKCNINNYKVLELLLSYFSEKEIISLFKNNKKTIIKSIYIYAQFNEYLIVQKLLKYLENNIFEIKFIQNIIFPPSNSDEYNEIINYFNNENFFDE